MSLFPSSPTVGQEYLGKRWDGTVWQVIGVNLSRDYVTTQDLASTIADIAIATAQPSLPSSPIDGVFWVDTDDTTLASYTDDIGFPTVFYSPTEPTGLDITNIGTIWTDGTDNSLQIWDGSDWVSAVVTFTYSSTQPTTPTVGQVWVNSADSNNIYVWTGAAWVRITQPGSSFAATQPLSPQIGQLWIDSDDNKIYVWSGSAWLKVGGGDPNEDQAVFASRMYG
jgi:hypothetical protein